LVREFIVLHPFLKSQINQFYFINRGKWNFLTEIEILNLPSSRYINSHFYWYFEKLTKKEFLPFTWRVFLCIDRFKNSSVLEIMLSKIINRRKPWNKMWILPHLNQNLHERIAHVCFSESLHHSSYISHITGFCSTAESLSIVGEFRAFLILNANQLKNTMNSSEIVKY